MTSFFYQTAQSLINQYPDRFPLLKITHLLDWQTIEAKLQSKKIIPSPPTTADPPIPHYPCSEPYYLDNGTAYPTQS